DCALFVIKSNLLSAAIVICSPLNRHLYCWSFHRSHILVCFCLVNCKFCCTSRLMVIESAQLATLSSKPIMSSINATLPCATLPTFNGFGISLNSSNTFKYASNHSFVHSVLLRLYTRFH